MMDPISAVGLAGSVIGIVDIIGRSLVTLYGVQQKLKQADLILSTLIAELTTTRAALDQIQKWIDEKLNNDDQHFQLIMDLDATLTNCRLLVSTIDMHIFKAQEVGTENMNFEQRLRVVRSEYNIQDQLDRLSRVIAALNCIISAFNARDPGQQKIVLYEKPNRNTLDQMKDDSSSLIALYDGSSAASLRTKTTTATSKFSLRFDFDAELFRHKSYQNSFRALMRRADPRRSEVRSEDKSPAEAARISTKIDKSLEKDAWARRSEVKVPFFGDLIIAAKTAISIKSAWTENKNEDDRSGAHPAIIASVICQVQNLVNVMDLESQDENVQAAAEAFIKIDKTAKRQYLPEDVTKAMQQVWQATKFYPSDEENTHTTRWIYNEKYFFNLIKRLKNPESPLTDLDIFLCSMADHAMIETKVNVVSINYNLILAANLLPVGKWGQRLFEHVESTVYFVDLLSYSRSFENEDISTTELMEVLAHFDAVVNSKWFPGGGIVLIFSNVDLFKSELENRPLERYFPDYSGGSDVNRALRYMYWRFNQLNRRNFKIYPELTNSGFTDVSLIIYAIDKARINWPRRFPVFYN